MKPTEAGFHGRKGVNLNSPHMPDGGIYKLRGGNTQPQLDKYNFRNQLLWIEPDNEDAKLYYCNHNNQLFELDFIPVEL